MDVFIEFLKWLKVDRAVMFAVLSKIWSLFSAPITLLMMTRILKKIRFAVRNVNMSGTEVNMSEHRTPIPLGNS